MTLVDQIACTRAELETREQAYPLRVEMKRMTKKEAEAGLAQAKAILRSLELMAEIQKCAKHSGESCVHCKSVSDSIEEVMTNG